MDHQCTASGTGGGRQPTFDQLDEGTHQVHGKEDGQLFGPNSSSNAYVDTSDVELLESLQGVCNHNHEHDGHEEKGGAAQDTICLGEEYGGGDDVSKLLHGLVRLRVHKKTLIRDSIPCQNEEDARRLASEIQRRTSAPTENRRYLRTVTVAAYHPAVTSTGYNRVHVLHACTWHQSFCRCSGFKHLRRNGWNRYSRRLESLSRQDLKSIIVYIIQPGRIPLFAQVAEQQWRPGNQIGNIPVEGYQDKAGFGIVETCTNERIRSSSDDR